MAKVSYDSSNYTITIDGAEEVSEALGELKSKTPAAVKVAVNATAREARKLMIAKAKARYAVNAAGQKHLKDLVQRGKATNAKPIAELHIKSFRNDLGYFDYKPESIYTGRNVANAPEFVNARVLKMSPLKPLTGEGRMSKGFVLKFSSGHIGVVQRIIDSNSKHKTTAKGFPRWKNKDGYVEKLRTMGSPSATAMHNTIWPEVQPGVSKFLQMRLDAQVRKVIERARKAGR